LSSSVPYRTRPGRATAGSEITSVPATIVGEMAELEGNGIGPNGTWNLFANDDQVLGQSDILRGWCVRITTEAPPAPPTTHFCNPAPIVQPQPFTFASGASVPYPSPIAVSGLTGPVTDVNVSLLGVTTRGEAWPEDMDILAAAHRQVRLPGQVGLSPQPPA